MKLDAHLGRIATAGGTTGLAPYQSTGAYRMEASLGAMRMSIEAHRKGGKMPDPMSPGSGAMVDRYVEYVPDRYNDKTELTVTVEPGMNKHDFKLEGNSLPSADKK